jgi:hypothetical protein
MRTSSFGLAAALMLASLNSASAGFASRPHFMPPARAIFANHASANHELSNRVGEIGRFDARDSNIFRHDRNGQLSFFPSIYQVGSPSPPPSDIEPFGLGAGAPIINVTLVAPAPARAYAGPRPYAASGGPKIILIGAQPRLTHFAKMPIVVYGTQVDGTY